MENRLMVFCRKSLKRLKLGELMSDLPVPILNNF